tara:strand:+ start:263 stop:469 length:207 start_codon:yes stop_codon:yes gene_type:complete
MGDYYDFEIREIDGKDRTGFCYQNKSTNYKEVFVELSDAQCRMAIRWHKKQDDILKEKDEMIKAFLGL